MHIINFYSFLLSWTVDISYRPFFLVEIYSISTPVLFYIVAIHCWMLWVVVGRPSVVGLSCSLRSHIEWRRLAAVAFRKLLLFLAAPYSISGLEPVVCVPQPRRCIHTLTSAVLTFPISNYIASQSASTSLFELENRKSASVFLFKYIAVTPVVL